MLCVVIKGPTFEEAYRQIEKAIDHADLIELRLDGFSVLDLSALSRLSTQFSIPMIFTLRCQSQGGHYSQSEEKRLTDIWNLAALNPEYLDLENHVPPDFIAEISSQHPNIKIILSYHNFNETPEDLEKLYQEMKRIPAHFYKIAVMPQSCLDAMRLVCWAKSKDDKLIAISMGYHGQVSRILAPFTYAALEEDQQTAPGQLSAKTLLERYRHRSLTSATGIYGLIGDPVDRSISDETHNHFFQSCGIDAVYVKIQVNDSELAEFLQFAKKLPFKGLSVTMPLKECILPYLDYIDPDALEIGAVNTLVFDESKIRGFNTDGLGALNAIESECRVKGKRVIILGAGGAAKAIAFEACRRGALVTILNRHEEKASLIAQHFHCKSGGLDQMAAYAKAGYDILINCTPTPIPIAVEYILPQAIVMDITTKPKETEFLKKSKEKGCRIIYGYRMFVEQAVGQFNLWFKGKIDSQESRNILEREANKALKGR